MATATAVNSFFIRTSAELPDSSVRVSNLTLGPAPSGGGGGTTIFETASPGTPASSFANGNAAQIDVLKISNVDLLAGFTLRGQVTMVFAQADPQPTGRQLVFEIFTADDGNPPDFPDRDGDGVEDGSDNCVNDANADQVDDDKDGLGDVCDNCPFDPNPGQEDGDGDGAGDACDNCPLNCTVIFPSTASCANPDQFDTDGDMVGDRCDNCRFTKNGPDEAEIPGVGDQDDSNSNNIGDACEPSTVTLDLGASVGGGGGFTASSSGTLGAFSTALQNPTAIDIDLECAQNVLAANIGLALPEGADFINFGGCTPAPSDPDDNNLMECDFATDLGETVSPALSTTIGKPIRVPAGMPPLNVILRLKAVPDDNNGLLCQINLDGSPGSEYLGKLLLDLPPLATPTVSTEGFELFEPDGLQLLEAPGDADFLESQILTRVIAETDLATLTLRPATDGDLRRYKLTVQSDRLIHKMAFGITTSSLAEDPVFGGCTCSSDDPACLDDDFPPEFPPQVGALELTGCAEDFANPDLGSEVDRPTFFEEGGPAIATFVAQPYPIESPPPPFVRNTLYIALQGAHPAGAGRASLNTAGQESELGIIEFSADTPTPQVTFVGADALPGFSPGGQVVPSSDDEGQAILVEDVSLLNRFDADEDLDGDGVGDDSDNCVMTPNGGFPGQLDDGGVAFRGSDKIGNVCQCGDTGDGIVDDDSELTIEDDVTNCQQELARGDLVDNPIAEKCRVIVSKIGELTVNELNIVDVVVMELEIKQAASSGLENSNKRLQACDPANELQ